tara:strand:+ start:1756 stop:1980 length:225 start_codon:yes stop_codon:yes gene_type:complete
MEFLKNGKSVIIKKDENESYDMFYERGNFIISQINSKNLDDLIKLSKIYINIKFKKCIYNKDIYNIIKKMKENI